MRTPIAIELTKTSKLSSVDFNNIPFGRVFSDHMYVADYNGKEWINPRIVPFGHFMIHPANLALHYGQSIFEGMKAAKQHDGKPVLIRPEMHSRRLNASAVRMCMPEFPEDMFLDALHTLLAIDREWIPTAEGSALYIRPYMFATGEYIGVQASDVYRMIIFSGPVGPYYNKPVKLLAEEKYVRAARGGVGEAKTSGNYAASLLPAKLAKEKGFDQVLWLDAQEFKYVQEVGTMNIFFVIGDKIVTPSTDGAILRGITRESIIDLLKDQGYEVEKRPVSIEELVEAYHNGSFKEAFGTGTAAWVAHVAEIQYKDTKMILPPVEERKIGQLAYDLLKGVRLGTLPDKHNWVVPVRELQIPV
ncbi:MAG TPA: branched-chain amino acid aminotransferase [Saprospiraceae bacterium]|nr:branched-chain amino acid aminotransferase [Saprospiraceae bacterium]MCC6688885.1 branched-chain amino acid aminotransferase [Saprospiraceae bacterium]HMV23737.1 branched-chain amino acid aminotransferase [Saprospiraceae bacterium]HMX83119.1 branched-chain amino acid aminotransferase [Saprospiraceae bacterium]HMZ72978.1 branched-chain amino acid aminotransferase [Saprospiraceae bacterium]